MLGLPAHRGCDARAPAGMIVENELLKRPGIELAIFTQHHVHIRLAIGLLGGIQSVHVRFELHGAGDGVTDWRGDEQIEEQQNRRQRQHREVGDPANIPRRPPLRQREINSPIDERETYEDQHSTDHQPFVLMIENVMANLVAHRRLNLRQRAALQQVIVQRDSHRIGETADVCAHPIRLPEASNSYPSLAGIPLARAIRRIESLTRTFSRLLYLLKRGAIYTGAIKLTNAKKTIMSTAPQTHQVLPRRRTSPNKGTIRIAPSTTPTASPTSWSRIHSPKF